MEKVKVLHTIRQGLIGGGETHVLDLVKHLDSDKFESRVLSFTQGPMIDRLKELGVECDVIETTRPFDLRIYNQLKTYLTTHNFDLIHAHGTRAASNLLWPAKALKIPIIYTVHGWSFHDDQGRILKKLRILSEKYISNRTDLNISVSKSNQETGKKYFGNYHSTVVNNGIDLDKFKNNGQSKNIRESLGISNDKILIICAMRMTKQKNPLGIIEAFAKASKVNDQLHLLLVGDGELKDSAINRVEQLHIKNKVTFEKFRTDIPDLLSESDIYCIPSLWEGLPIGLLEAMGMGLPSIATNVDGSKEIIENDSNGLLVTPKNNDELAEAILKLSNNPDLMKQFSLEAVKTIEKRYNVIGMTKKIETLYTNILT